MSTFLKVKPRLIRNTIGLLLSVTTAYAFLITSCTDNTDDSLESSRLSDTLCSTETPCVSETESVQASGTEPAVTTPKEKKAIAEQLQKKYGLTEATYPKTDCAFSSVPVCAGLTAAYFGLSQLSAETDQKYSSEQEAFENLINGKADAVFIHELSEEQKKAAADKQMEIESIPVTNEALVFMVSSDNPISDLTSDQLRKIYSGEITNWSEVGGKDVPILAYQRYDNVPAQIKMQKFINSIPMAEPPADPIEKRCSPYGAVEKLHDYVNSESSIGYAVYSEELEKYYNYSEVSFISVDGIKPNTHSIQTGKYPLTDTLFYSFVSDQKDDSAVRKLAEYINSDDGKNAIQSSDFSSHLVSTKGTGPQKPESESEQLNYCYVNLTNIGIERIKNKSLYEYMKKWKDSLSDNAFLQCEAINGYMFAYSYERSNEDEIVLTQYDIFDLYTGQKLNFSDLFYKDTDYVMYYNKAIRDQIGERYLNIYDGFHAYGYKDTVVPLKREFCGITDDCAFLSFLDAYNMFFSSDNFYFDKACTFNRLSGDFIYKNSIVFSQPQDMKKVIKLSNDEISLKTVDLSVKEEPEFTYGHHELIGSIRMNKLIDKSTVYDQDKINRINQKARDIARDSSVADLLMSYSGKSTECTDQIYRGSFLGYGLDIEVYPDKNTFSVSLFSCTEKQEVGFPTIIFFYDTDSFEKLTNDKIMKRFFGDNYSETPAVRFDFDKDILKNEDIMVTCFEFFDSKGFIEFSRCGDAWDYTSSLRVDKVE